jgi:hypothetical protein
VVNVFVCTLEGGEEEEEEKEEESKDEVWGNCELLCRYVGAAGVLCKRRKEDD